MKECYVYAVFVEGALKYIGKGKGDRFEHGCSGTSGVFGLNQAFFEGKTIEVGILKDRMLETDALLLELDLIKAYGSSANTALFNQVHNTIHEYEAQPNMTEAELYDACNIVRKAKYVKGDYAKSLPSVYNKKNLGQRFNYAA